MKKKEYFIRLNDEVISAHLTFINSIIYLSKAHQSVLPIKGVILELVKIIILFLNGLSILQSLVFN